MQEKLAKLKARLREVNDLQSAAALLQWDQATYMPRAGAAARARQVATLQRLAHEQFIDEGVGRLLEEMRPYEQDLPYDSDEAGLLRVARREYERAAKVPAGFTARMAEHQAASYEVWTRARPANDFAAVRGCLEKTVDLSRELAGFFPGCRHIADPLIDFADYGLTVALLRPLFAELRGELTPLVEAIAAAPPPDDACRRQFFDPGQQLDFGLSVVRQFGYDFDRGRQDQTHHPFMTKFSLGDVRITTRVKPNDLGEALFSTLHEAGHALYEQGINPDYEGTVLAHGASAGVHESQSRLWENLVGRSLVFWQHAYPRLQTVFRTQLGHVPLATFYRAINKVQRSLIRTEADEVTYNLHVMIRFELELALLEGKLAVGDLPEAWRAAYRRDLGLEPSDDRDGVLQDVHWYAFQVGGCFQCYTLGNLMSAQFHQAALQARPDIPADIAAGRFDTLHGWLREHLYRHGSKYTAAELLQRVTGGPLQVGPYLRYLKQKYAPLYGV